MVNLGACEPALAAARRRWHPVCERCVRASLLPRHGGCRCPPFPWLFSECGARPPHLVLMRPPGRTPYCGSGPKGPHTTCKTCNSRWGALTEEEREPLRAEAAKDGLGQVGAVLGRGRCGPVLCWVVGVSARGLRLPYGMPIVRPFVSPPFSP